MCAWNVSDMCTFVLDVLSAMYCVKYLYILELMYVRDQGQQYSLKIRLISRPLYQCENISYLNFCSNRVTGLKALFTAVSEFFKVKYV